MNHRPTGLYRVRRGWFGKLILQDQYLCDFCLGSLYIKDRIKMWKDCDASKRSDLKLPFNIQLTMVSPVKFKIESSATGQLRVRRGVFGKMILQMQFNYDERIGMKTEHNVGTIWRDATEADLNIKYATNITLSN